MAGDCVLGVDIGTTTLKAGLFDPRGRRLHAFARPLAIRHAPGGLAEQDPEAWLDALRAVLAEIAAAQLMPRLGALGVTSQVNTHVFVDAAGRPLAPAIGWADTRAAAEAAEIDAGIAAPDRQRWWGAPMAVDASHALARMLWMARRRPRLWERTRAVLLPKDLALRALCGVLVSDPLSHVGLVGADGTYPPDLLARVPGAAERLPPLRPPTALAGPAPAAGGAVAAVGVMDAWAGFLGAGLRADGDAAWLSGTSEVLAAAAEAGPGAPGLLVFPRLAGLRVHAGPTQAGGAAADWFGALHGLTPAALAAEVAAAGDGLRAPLFLPHLAGERAPLWDARARGAFLGLEAGMGRAALARGVLEGVAFSARLVAEALDRAAGRRLESWFCGGGGFRSDVWAQIRADATGRILARSRVPEAGVMGAAALAAVAAGLQPDLPAALADLVAHDRVFEPDPRRRAAYDDLFALYRPAWEALRPISRALADRPAGAGAGGALG